MTTREDRSRRSVLENGIECVDAYERRILADMRNAGWHFRSIASARRQLTTLRAVDRFNTDQDADALAEALNKRRTA